MAICWKPDNLKLQPCIQVQIADYIYFIWMWGAHILVQSSEPHPFPTLTQHVDLAILQAGFFSTVDAKSTHKQLLYLGLIPYDWHTIANRMRASRFYR